MMWEWDLSVMLGWQKAGPKPGLWLQEGYAAERGVSCEGLPFIVHAMGSSFGLEWKVAGCSYFSRGSPLLSVASSSGR